MAGRPKKIQNNTVSEQVVGPRILSCIDEERWQKLEGYDPEKFSYVPVQTKWPGENGFYAASAMLDVDGYEARGYSVVSTDSKITGHSAIVLMAAPKEVAAQYMPTPSGNSAVDMDAEIIITSRDLQELYSEAKTAKRTRPGAEYLENAPVMREAIEKMNAQE